MTTTYSTYAFFSDSSPAAATLALEGVWIHDPTDAAGSVAQFRFGKDARSTKIDTGGTAMVFAGRRYPVIDYGEHQDDQYAVSVQVPHGPDYRTGLETLRAFAESRTTLVYRDNRGRDAYGVITEYAEGDQSWGSEVTFSFTRVDVEQVTA
ncbi:hypothetical protein [Actinomadura sp. K4S16]|uniref:hypothetical protein n=1 Tax=Actinomadura sp. K4S16 TaxID=1316147 RepID=UPI0011ECB5B4|nr:hypothetical protein [Actinomadura sp. K4S16]